jgi:hypothetical protein
VDRGLRTGLAITSAAFIFSIRICPWGTGFEESSPALGSGLAGATRRQKILFYIFLIFGCDWQVRPQILGTAKSQKITEFAFFFAY